MSNNIRIRLADKWRAGEEFLFTLRLGEILFNRQWTQYRGLNDRRRHEFRFYWETDLTRLGGGETVAAASILETDDYFHPISYELFSDRLPLQRAVFREGNAELTLADDSVLTLNLSRSPDLVLQQNVLGQLGCFLSLFPPREWRIIKANYFSPEGLTVREVIFEQVSAENEESGIKWRTSLGADLICDTENKLRQVVIAKSNVSASFEEAMFPDVEFSSLRKSQVSAYAPPANARFVLEETTFATEDHVNIGAAITVPIGAAERKSPAFLFIQGSGRHDRHGMAPGIDTGIHEIADYLSNNGYVGLRFDSRGSGGTSYGPLLEMRYQTLINDAKAAFATLRHHHAVSENQLFVIGHSLGALTALHLALDPDALPIKGLVLLAPPGRSFDQILTQQALREARRLGFTEEQISDRRQTLASYFQNLRGGTLEKVEESTMSLAGVQAKVLREILEIDPAQLLVRVKIPILSCQGLKDIQVSVKCDTLRLLSAAAGFLEAAAKSGNTEEETTTTAGETEQDCRNGDGRTANISKAATEAGDESLDSCRPTNSAEEISDTVKLEVRIFPNLDHLFKVEPLRSSPERYYVQRPTGADFLGSLLSWLNAQL